MSLPLLTAISDIDLTISVEGQITDASGPGVITIESEQIAYVGNSVNQFLGLTRGYNGTTAVAHAVGTRLTYVPNEPAGVGDITGMLPINVSGGHEVLIGGSATISIPAASTSVSGYLSSSDWNSFDGRVHRAGDTMSGDLDMGGNVLKHGFLTNLTISGNLTGNGTGQLIDMADPVNPQDYATKNYVDSHAGAVGANGTVQLSDGSGGFTSSVPNFSFLLDDGFGSTKLEIKQNGQHTNTLRFNGENSYIAAYADDNTTRIAYIQMETGAGIILHDSPSAAELEVYNGHITISNADLQLGSGGLDAGGNPIFSVPTPVDPGDAANKSYVDTHPGPTYGNKGDLQLADGSGSFDTDNNPGFVNFTQLDGDGDATLLLRRNGLPVRLRIAGLPASVTGWTNDNTFQIGYLQFGDGTSAFVRLNDDTSGSAIQLDGTGVTLQGPVSFVNDPINAGTNHITNLADPINPQDGATKNYVDTANGAPFLPLSGGAMAGQLDMNGNNIANATTIVADEITSQPVTALKLWARDNTQPGITFGSNADSHIVAVMDMLNNNMEIGTGVTPSAVSVLQLDSTTQGLLGPRMTTTQRNAISSPPEGLQIYNLTTHTIEYWNGSAWTAV